MRCRIYQAVTSKLIIHGTPPTPEELDALAEAGRIAVEAIRPHPAVIR